MIRQVFTNQLKKSISIKQLRPFSTTKQRQAMQPQILSPIESALKYFGSLPTIPLGIFTVPNNHASVITRFGKFERTAYEGLRFTMPMGSRRMNIFLGNQSFKLPNSKVVDSNGNPIIISAVVNYKVTAPENFVVNIGATNNYIHNQAEATIKKIASKYPYDSNDGKNLKSEVADISLEMKNELQKLVDDAGVEIIDIHLTDLNYAPEIASSMLIKQQAKAYIDAKNEIANSSVDIVKATLENITKMGINMDDQSKNKLVTNLVTVIASGNSVQPTIPVS